MFIPNTPTRDQEEVLTTLRALAGLVAHASRQKVALSEADADEDSEQALERVSTDLRFWRDILFHHTRRLLPVLVGDGEVCDYRQFAEWLVGDVYLHDLEAIAHHNCDPLTCVHSAHERG